MAIKDDAGKPVRILNPNGFAEWPIRGDERIARLARRVGMGLGELSWLQRFGVGAVHAGVNIGVLFGSFWIVRRGMPGLPGAQTLDKNYMVAMQLPIPGSVRVLVGEDEEDEAVKIAEELERLFAEGHPDVEGGVQLSKCAILGRTRFALLAVEAELKKRGISFYKRLTANHENESDAVDAFQLALRVLANPKDRLHLAALAKKWKVREPSSSDFLVCLATMAGASHDPHAHAVQEAVQVVAKNPARLDLTAALKALQKHADTLDEAQRLAIYEDVAVVRQDWDQFLRSAAGAKTLGAFISSKALGAYSGRS